MTKGAYVKHGSGVRGQVVTGNVRKRDGRILVNTGLNKIWMLSEFLVTK